MTDYKQVAKKLGCTFRIGKYGVKLLPNSLPGQPRRLLSFTPLDGWIFDPDEIVRAIRLDDDMGVTGLVSADKDTSKGSSNSPVPLQKEQKR